ncbi:hypothetical protein L581_3903 [Serratia fonticola AU-AP2C]|nr:hypothetical protein L581_3903 [Serratia fonticola AU-AP2C]
MEKLKRSGYISFLCHDRPKNSKKHTIRCRLSVRAGTPL